jgi:hypothetical protein
MSNAAFLQRIKAPRRLRQSVDDFLADCELERCEERAKQNGGSVRTERFCDCRELLIDGERQPCPPRHDCDYVRARSQLVPIAAKAASAHVPDDTANGDRWTRLFVAEMEKLSASLLAQSSSGLA